MEKVFAKAAVRAFVFLFGFCVSALCVSIVPAAAAENSGNNTDKPLFTWDFLWTGSWLKNIHTDGELSSRNDPELFSPELFAGGTMYNRGNLAVGMPRQDLSFRFLATDKRVLPPAGGDGKAGFNPALGLYHRGSGSRFLYGVQSEYGLPARIQNVWARAVPFLESRSPSSRDLKAEPSAEDEPEAYLYLGLPRNLLPGFDVFASAALDSEKNPAFTGGAGWHGTAAEVRLEGFYTHKTLAQRLSQSWFSPAPPLPERDFGIYALALVFYSPWVSFASDWALSETFAWGRGMYGNFALRAGNKPWRLSLAGDGAENRFAGRDGSAAGSGFRLAARGEYFRPRSGLFRVQGTLRSPGLADKFNRGAFSLYFRPSAPTAAQRRNAPFSARFSRASLSVSRDARNPDKTEDVLNSTAGFYLGPLTGVFSCAFHSLSFLGGDDGSLFHGPFFGTFDSFRVSGDLGWTPPAFRFGTFNIRTRLGYTVRAEKDPLWELSFNSSFRPGKWGRVGLKIASTDFPEKWNYALTWRFEAQLP